MDAKKFGGHSKNIQGTRFAVMKKLAVCYGKKGLINVGYGVSYDERILEGYYREGLQ